MRKKYPFVAQTDIKNCGPAALAMVIQFYKGYMSIEKLTQLLKTSKKGTSAYHIVNGAKELGFEARGFHCEVKDLVDHSSILPCIANVILDASLKHYVVIYKIDMKRKRILIADPAKGIFHISFESFEAIFNHVIIMLYPIRPIPLTKTNRLLPFCLTFMKSYWKMMFHIVILSIFITIFSVFTSFYLENMIQVLQGSKAIDMLYFVFFLFFGVTLLKAVTHFFRNEILIRLNQKIDYGLTTNFFQKLIHLPYHYCKNRTTGDMISRIEDLSTIRTMITKLSLALFVDFPIGFVSFIFLYLIQPKLCLLAVFLLGINMILLVIFQKIFDTMLHRCQRKKGEITGYMVESISGYETVKGLGLESKILEKFERQYFSFCQLLHQLDQCYNRETLCKMIINESGFLLIILCGGILVLKQQLSFGSLFTFHTLFSYFLGPIQEMIQLNREWKEAQVTLERLLELPLEEETVKGLDVGKMSGTIRCKNLIYGFDSSDLVLNHVSAYLEKGKKVMLIGESGGGKSTLVKILMKYYSVPREMCYIDGIDINDWDRRTILKHIVYISQNEILFTDTLYHNIMMESNNDRLFLDVVRMCHVDEIIAHNQLGYHTLIEENGANLSGGERQRIILARALLKPFEILIIDEGLSQLDINLERNILKQLFERYKEKTIILVSHRFDNMDLFDQVIQIQKGTVILDECRNRNNGNISKQRNLISNYHTT